MLFLSLKKKLSLSLSRLCVSAVKFFHDKLLTIQTVKSLRSFVKKGEGNVVVVFTTAFRVARPRLP